MTGGQRANRDSRNSENTTEGVGHPVRGMGNNSDEAVEGIDLPVQRIYSSSEKAAKCVGQLSNKEAGHKG